MEIITTHKNADFDAVASVFAASIHYPDAIRVIPKSLNANVRHFLSIHKDHFLFQRPKDIHIVETKKLILVDTSNMGRLEGFETLKKAKDMVVHVWDHHLDVGDIEADWIRCEPLGATVTLLVRSFEKEKRTLSPIEATLFIAGIYEDTGSLTFPSTTAEDARAVAYLLGQKADLRIIRNFLRPLYGPRQKDILFDMLKDSKRSKLNGYTVSLNRLSIEGNTPGLSVVVDMYRDIVNVDAAFGIFTEERKKRCMVIGRSVGDGLNIGMIMRSLGGGGHPNAGSALLKSVKPEAVEAWIRELIQGNQEASVKIGDLMSFPVFTVHPETTMQEVASMLREKGCTGIPVVEKDKVVGIISRRDISRVRKQSQMSAPVKAFMSVKVVHISPESSVFQAARLMIRNDIGRLPVVENGNVIGIITRSDTMRYYYDMLPD